MKRMNLLVLLTLFVVGKTYSEGTKQMAPTSSDTTLFVINDSDFGNFAAYNGPEESKLCFEITNANEEVFLGLSPSTLFSGVPNGASYFFRIKDSNGIIVHGPFSVGPGNANATDYASTIAGPDAIDPAGYDTSDPIFHFLPPSNGKYCIEFSVTGLEVEPLPFILIFQYLDITVAANNGGNYSAIDGRLFSQKWAIRTPNISDNDDFDRPFNGQVFCYSTKGFVSKIDFASSGFQGLAFNIAFNSFGTMNSGDVVEDRKSLEDQNSVIGQHLVFLNDPDETIYPSGILGDIVIGPQLLSCESTCIQLEVTHPGQVDIIIDFDNASGDGVYDLNSTDVILALKVSEDDISQGNFMTCVPWDGNDGLGNPVDLDIPIPIYAIYSQGVSHFAVYDVELNLTGFTVETVRPLANGPENPVLFYDDTNLITNNDPGTGAPLQELNGCVAPCHNWNNLANEDQPGYGNKNTINTWWQINVVIAFELQPGGCPLVLEKDSLLLDCGTFGSVDVLENDFSEITDLDPGSLEIVSGPNNGNASLLGGGFVQYIPDEFFAGRDTLVYRVCNELTPEPLCDTEIVCFIVAGGETTLFCPEDLFLTCGDENNDDLIQDWLNSFDATNECLDLILNNDYNGLSDGCGETGTALVTFSAADPLGNVSTCQANVTIIDNEPPDFEACVPLDMTIQCQGQEENINAVMNWYLGNVGILQDCTNDACDDTPLVALSLVIPPDYDGLVGSVQAFYVSTDDCGMAMEIDYTITIIDSEPPTIECPDDLIVDASDENLEQIISDWLASVDTSDLCGPLVLIDSYDPDGFTPGCENSGFQDVVFTVTDGDGNSSTCEARITITDDNPPEINCPADLTLECGDPDNGSDIIAWLNLATAMNSDGEPLTVFNNYDNAPFVNDCGTTGTYTITFIATNECQISAECSADIIIVDTQAPVLDNCPNLNAEEECAGQTINEDNILNWHQANIDALNNCAVDQCDQDLTGQIIADINLQDFEFDCGITGSITVDYLVYDDCDNSSLVSYTFTIVDTEAPQLNQCGSLDVTIDCAGASENESLADTWNEENITALEQCAFDICDSDLNGSIVSNYDYGNLIGDCGITGEIEVIYTVSDDCENSSTFTAVFIIVDNTPPTAEFPPDLTLSCEQDPFDLNLTGEVTDIQEECSGGESSFEDDIDLSSCNNTGVIERLWTVEDDCGNKATAIQVITVVDNTNPEFTAPQDVTLECNQDPNNLDLTGRVTDATDNCGVPEVEYFDDLSNYDEQSGQGFIIRRWVVTDACGNSAEDEQVISFEECSGSIGDFVWEDLDGDGIQDPNEPGIPGIEICLIQDDEVIECVTTDNNGFYLFDDVPAGNYCLIINFPDDYELSDPFQGNNGTRDSDFEDTEDGFKTPVFNLSGGEEERDLDAGLFRCVTFGDFVWYDLDTDNIQDQVENGINGLNVQIFKSNGELVDEQYTGHKPGTPSDDGYYEFCVRPGCYYIKINLPPFGLVLAQTDQGGNDNIDNDFGFFNGPITSRTFCVQSGDPLVDNDAGFYPMAEMGDVVWFDEDGDGRQDPHEQGMANVEVKCYNIDDQLISTTTTDGSGEYNVDYLQQQAYYLKFIPPEGYSPTVSNVGDDINDSDIDNTNGLLTTPLYNLESGVAEANVDAGFQLGSLPVELLSFNGKREKDYNILNWVTATEINNNHFILERRFETDNSFAELARIDGNGTISFEHEYQYKDYDIEVPGTYYYRLIQVDYNGKSEDKGTIAINVENLNKETVNIYPNPSKGRINITISALNSGNQISIDLLTSEGKLLSSNILKEGSADLDFHEEINLDQYSRGVYLLKIAVSDRVYYKKIILLY